MDLRMSKDRKVYCVDVNANCSVDVDPDTAMGLILRTAGINLTEFLKGLIVFAFKRHLGLDIVQDTNIVSTKLVSAALAA